eukprot:g9379.t1
MAAVRRPSTAARGQPKPRTGANRPDPHHLDDGNGHATGSTNGWSAHLRYFLARYPPEARDFVAQRLTAYGIRSLLSSNRVEDLILHALVSATDAADRDVLSLMRQHARGRREQRDGRQVTAASARRSGVPSPRRQHQPHGNGGSSPAPREALRDCGIARNTNAAARVAPALPAAAGSGKRHEVVGRPDVLTRYPFVDHLGATQGGGVGAALHRATPTTPIQYLAKREIRRLAHDAFRELKASALGIRLSDLPCALQFLFFGDSASLLTAKGGGTGGGGGGSGGSGGGGGGVRAVGRNAKDVHLVMALARECLPPTLALAARDTSTLSSASTHGGAEAGWVRDGQWKEGTRPAGMWEVTPPAHVAALRRGRRQGGGGGGGGREGGRRGGGPAYLRDVQSRIGPHLNAHRERLRKIASARRAAVKDVVARRRLDQLAGGGGGGGGIGMHGGGGRRDSSAADWGSQARGHTPGEHALDIAGAFLESSLMTRLAGGDWFDSEDGEPTSAEFSSAWETEEAVRVPPLGGRRHNRASSGPSMGRHGLDHNGGGGVGGRRESSRREEGGHGDATRRRQAYTGWLGDFGPVHTHTVREVADAGDGDDEEDRSEGDIDGAGADAGSGGRNRRDPAGREEGEGKGGTRRSWQLEEGGAPGRGGVGGGDDAAERSDGTAEEAGVDESTAAVASVAASGRGADATLSGAADSSSEAQALGGGGDSTGGPEAGADDGRNNNINEDDDGGNVGTAETGAANIVAPLDGGLDAYLQLASDSGALHGGGGAALGGGGGGDGGSGGGLGPGVGVGGGSPGAYTGATSGSWWEEDRSEVGTSPP